MFWENFKVVGRFRKLKIISIQKNVNEHDESVIKTDAILCILPCIFRAQI